jgi:acyl-CoA thioester hydrolase
MSPTPGPQAAAVASDASGGPAPSTLAAPADDVPRLAAEYRVRFDEAGPDGLMRGSTLLGIVQDLAWRHSEALGLTREWYAERGLLWLVRAVEVRFLAPVAHGDTVRAETMIVGYRRVLARRRTRLWTLDGTPVADVATDWVMTSAAAGGPTRIADEIVGRFAGAGSFEPVRVDRAEPPADAAAVTAVVGLRDLDPVGHMNNSVYLDLLDESVAAAGAGLSGTFPRRVALEYVDAGRAGETVVARAWPTAAGWSHRLERATDGATLVRGAVAAEAEAG